LETFHHFTSTIALLIDTLGISVKVQRKTVQRSQLLCNERSICQTLYAIHRKSKPSLTFRTPSELFWMNASIQFSSAETALKLDKVTPAAKGC
jgi:hypothetical protein